MDPIDLRSMPKAPELSTAPAVVLGCAAFLALAIAGCGDDGSPPESFEAPREVEAEATSGTPEVVTHVDIDDVDTCDACHGRIVQEWRTSMHAHAHHSEDPIYAAMRGFRMAREGDETALRCAQCHGPRDLADLESGVARGGVTCATCHNLSGVDLAEGTHRGSAALQRATDDTLRGPHDIDSEAAIPHGVGAAAPWLTDGRTACLACHGAMENREGVPTCTTGTEAIGADEPCTSCHMPEVEGASGIASRRTRHRSHAFLGPHELYGPGGPGGPGGLGGSDFMATALGVTVSFEGGRLAVTLENRTGHAMPSGFPGRMVLVRATGFDVDGEAVWHNFTDAPMTQDPDAVLNKVYLDEEGLPTMPPYGVRLARDTRLAPRETRELEWRPPAAVVRAEITVIYRLLPPGAAERLGVAERPEARGRPIVTLAVDRE